MHISAVCPRCGNVYNVQPSLRGQAMRCPNPRCRNVFMVQDPDAPQAGADHPAAPGAGLSGSVGEMVPILPAEPMSAGGDAYPPAEQVANLPFAREEPPAPAEAPLEQAADWRQPPPVRRPGADAPRTPPPRTRPSPGRRSARIEKTPPEGTPALPHVPDTTPPPPSGGVDTRVDSPEGPRVLGPGAWDAPPVRRGEPGAFEPAAEGATAAEAPPAPPRRFRWLRRGLVAFFLLAVALGAGGYYAFQGILGKTEEKLAQEAKDHYENKQYRAAGEVYEQLPKNFPSSPHLDEYKFLQDLSELRARVAENPQKTPLEVLAVLDHFKQFLKERAKDSFLEQYGSGVGESLTEMLVDYTKRYTENPTDEALQVTPKADEVLKLARDAGKGKVLARTQEQQVRTGLAEMGQSVARMQHHRAVLARVRKIADTLHPVEARKQIDRLLREEAPELSGDSKVAAVREELDNRTFTAVTYTPEPGRAPPRVRSGAVEQGILFDPVLRGALAQGRRGDPVVLAVARGVLYALRQSDGQVQWAMRVGVDTTTLPVRVPATQSSRERILVLSSDTQTLTALDTEGNALWRYRLSSPCLGRPLVVDQRRAYLSTYDGQVHEIELVEGKLLGRYHLGQRLTTGGARDPQTKRLYFPADDSCVYEIDPENRRCVTVLYTGHPAGSLRSEPVVVSPDLELENAPRYLILNQTQGLHRTQLRVWKLPITDPHQPPEELSPPAELDGWTWFPPYHDPEKLALLSDAGMLGVFGIRQAQTRDQPLFPLVAQGGLDLAKLLGTPGRGRRGRAELVQVQGNDLWVLASGRLQRLQLAWDKVEGPRLVPAWREVLDVGSPLHASQVVEDPRTGRSTLFVATQPLTGQPCWVTAVDDETGKVLWRRQLGVVCRGEPVRLEPLAKGAPLLVGMDQGGGLYSLDPTLYPDRPGVEWQSASSGVRLADPLEENPSFTPVLLRARDGKSAYAVACPGDGRTLVVRRVFQDPKRPRGLDVKEYRPVTLPGKLMGPPALAGDQLLLPMLQAAPEEDESNPRGDCMVARLKLPRKPGAPLELETGGPSWRSPRASPDALRYVVYLGGDRFVTTDGARGVTSWYWKGNDWHKLPEGIEEKKPTHELPNRIVAPPLLLPVQKGGAPARLCVADSGGNLTLLEVRPDGDLRVERTWGVGGEVSAGPFLRKLPGEKLRVGCVVDGWRLVWLDPARDKLLWEYRSPKRDALVGEPRLAGGLLVVADQSGRYVGLDLTSGKPVGPGHRLGGSVVPASSPVPFGPGRLLAPLSDGTALLLPLGHVEHPLRDFPDVW